MGPSGMRATAVNPPAFLFVPGLGSSSHCTSGPACAPRALQLLPLLVSVLQQVRESVLCCVCVCARAGVYQVTSVIGPLQHRLSLKHFLFGGLRRTSFSLFSFNQG